LKLNFLFFIKDQNVFIITVSTYISKMRAKVLECQKFYFFDGKVIKEFSS